MLSAKQVCRIAGLDYARLDYWARSGFLKPSINEASGKGSKRLYSFIDLLSIKVAKKLRDEGVSLQKLRKVIDYVYKHRQDIESPLANLVLITDGENIFELTSDPNIMVDILKSGQLIFAFAVDKLVDSAKNMLKKEGIEGIAI